MNTATNSNADIIQRAEPFFQAMAARVSPAEVEKMRFAFRFAMDAHAGQKRKTGEPYIIHPLAVAVIVGQELGLDTDPVCAAFLHDVVEDTHHTIEEISALFGEDVAQLVDVVTKSKSEHYVYSKQVDNFSHMLKSISYDIRALLIKLADRLHNMRTLSSMAPDKQMKIAGETDYFYAPLANRLGLYRVKIELENLSFHYRCPIEFAKLEKKLMDEQMAERPVLERFMDEIRTCLKDNGIDAHVEVDYRRPFSVRRKMQKTGQDFEHVEGKHFVRIVFADSGSLSEKGMALRIYAVLTDRIKEKPGSLLNYINAPKENGYQSLHCKLLNSVGRWEEIHISSERMRRVSRMGCMADREDTNIHAWIERLSKTLEEIDHHKHEIGFMEGVETSFYSDDITVYTKAGKSVLLPQKSTALDFAYEELGEAANHAKYARINGVLSSVKTVLHRGDCVEIGLSDDMVPKPDWLDHVCSFNARLHLNKYFHGLPLRVLVRCPECHPIPGEEVIGFRRPDGRTEVHKRDCPVAISSASQHGDNVKKVEFVADDTLYAVKVHIKAVDRYHLFTELIDCITNRLRLPIMSLHTVTTDEIVDCDIDFSVHSYDELQTVIDYLAEIPSVDEVWVNKPE